MTVHDELTGVQRCLDDLTRCVNRLEQQLGGSGLEMRRVRSDAAHLRESLALLKAATPEDGPAPNPAMVTIPDAPYDSSLWTDAEDEGLGAHDRHAP
jgi:hypothetical protein